MLDRALGLLRTPRDAHRRTAAAYAAAVLSTGLLLLLSKTLGEATNMRWPLIAFVLSITLSAWLGGFRPGLFATLVTTVVGASTITPSRGIVVGFYVAAGLAISSICEHMHRAVEEAAANAAALRASRELAREKLAEIQAIYETAPVGLCVLDTDLQCVRANERLARFSGKPAAEHEGRALRDILPSLAHAVEAAREQLLVKGEMVELEVTGETGSEGERSWTSTCYPLRAESGEIVGVNMVCEETTDRRRAAAEREAILTSERAARAEAERANRMKDDFLAVISHELRTPLNAVVGWTSILRRPGATPEQIEKGLTVIERNARVQTQLISDLLDVGRIMSGKIHVEMEPVTLSAVVGPAVDALRASATSRGVALDASIPREGPIVRGDPARIQQIVTNLVANAIKFTPKGGRVEVTLETRGDHVEITVRDTGEGIDPGFLPHVFDRFRQADTSLTRRHGGLGLGLSIVKHLVELHDGSVRAESDGPGRGATFTVQLRCEATPIAPEPAPPLSGEPASLRGVRVLVLDDEDDTRDLVARLLQEHHATVESASSAREAMEMLRKRAPDVLVSDIGMPETDGYALLREVRANGGADVRAMPAVALTAFARAEDREQAMNAGYQAHLAKPVEPAVLVATVASLARRVPRRAQAEPQSSHRVEGAPHET